MENLVKHMYQLICVMMAAILLGTFGAGVLGCISNPSALEGFVTNTNAAIADAPSAQ